MIRLDEVAAELGNVEFVAGMGVQVEEQIEELIVPQIRMLFPFLSNHISTKKDEVSKILVTIIVLKHSVQNFFTFKIYFCR